MNGHLRLVAVAAAIAGLAAPTAAQAVAQPTCPGADVSPTPANLDRVRAATLCLVNRERAAHRRAPLRASGELAKAASAYVNAMTARKFFAHVSPDGSTPASRIKVTLYLADARRWSIGENLAWGGGRMATPRQMVAAWMRSPGHRHNVLSSRFRHLGVGIAVGTPAEDDPGGATYATEFGVRVKWR